MKKIYKKTKKIENDNSVNKMENKPIGSLLISMSLPPLASMFMQYTYNFVDCIFVSWISEDALTAASLSFPLTTLMLAISIGIGVGINVLVSRKLGEKNYDQANNVTSHGLILASFFGLFFTFIFYFLIKDYFLHMTDKKNIYLLGLDYMYICVFLQLPNMVHIAIQKIIQATGNMTSPMLFQMAGVLLNFILDPILIFGLGFIPPMGIKGAAISTVLGYTFSMILAFYVLIFTKQRVKIKRKNFKIDKKIFQEIISLGMPSFIMNALGAFMVSFVNIFLLAYSNTAVAFFGAYFKAQQMVIMTVNGLIQGTIPIMSYNYGLKNYKRLNESLKVSTIFAIILMTSGALILFFFPEKILTIFMASKQMLVLGVPAVKIMSLSYIFNGISTMIASYMQATSKVNLSILINLSRQCLILFSSMWLLNKFFALEGIWYSFLLTEIFTFLIAIFLLKKYKINK